MIRRLSTIPEKMSPLYLVKCRTRSHHRTVDGFENSRLFSQLSSCYVVWKLAFQKACTSTIIVKIVGVRTCFQSFVVDLSHHFPPRCAVFGQCQCLINKSLMQLVRILHWYFVQAYTLLHHAGYSNIVRVSNPDMGVNLDPTDKVFSLQILVAQVILIKNLLDDIASPLGISSNMLIKAAITKISFFSIFSTIKHASNKRNVSIPMFLWSKNQIRLCLKSCCEWFIWNSIWSL